jgi:hypothetical protein
MAPYPEVVRQLFSAACSRGLSERTKVTAVADGGDGLYEELSAQFPDFASSWTGPMPSSICTKRPRPAATTMSNAIVGSRLTWFVSTWAESMMC